MCVTGGVSLASVDAGKAAWQATNVYVLLATEVSRGYHTPPD